MSIVLIRVDDRLIHGQVVVGWTRTVEGTYILVADDEVANNTMQKKLLKFATPTGVQSDILTVEESVKNLKEGDIVSVKVKNTNKTISEMLRKPGFCKIQKTSFFRIQMVN